MVRLVVAVEEKTTQMFKKIIFNKKVVKSRSWKDWEKIYSKIKAKLNFEPFILITSFPIVTVMLR
jgi:hypothetical protein